MRIGLVETPKLSLRDSNGNEWSSSYDYPLISKQILMGNLQAGGFETQLINLQKGTEEQEYGQVNWKGMTLRKISLGGRISSLDPQACDAWSVTSNFTIQREIACLVIRHLASGGKPVVVGGSDAFADPQSYLEAGATAVVTDKSGAANWAVFDYVLGKVPRTPLTGVVLADGTVYPKTIHPLSPQDWPLPSLQAVQECLMTTKKGILIDNILPLGSMIADQGCDRTCGFCQTPTYKLGYKRMTPERTLKWAALLKEAGARAISSDSDQFLGRVLFGEAGRQEIFDIVNGFREMELPVGWTNGLELKKATRGHGRGRDAEDFLPDEELVEAVWGWDGHVGCQYAYIPAERPVIGTKAYAKLLPWQQHMDMMSAIVRAGIPGIYYGVIVGLSDDSHESMLHLEEALLELVQHLKSINPALKFEVHPFAVCPFPGTPQRQNVEQSGLLRFTDPTILGNWWTPCADTLYLSYEEVSEWQSRLLRIAEDDAVINSVSALID